MGTSGDDVVVELPTAPILAFGFDEHNFRELRCFASQVTPPFAEYSVPRGSIWPRTTSM
jgi:hypothetical protein